LKGGAEMEELRKVDTRESVRVVTSNDLITAKGLETLSLKARKLFYTAIAQCRKGDKEFYTYEVTATEFADLMGILADDVYRESDKVTDELMKNSISLKNDSGKVFVKYSLFSRCEYINGILRFKLNPDLTDLLLQLKGSFSQPLLHDFVKMKSPYSIAIWHLIQREMKSKKPSIADVWLIDLKLDELREVTGTQNKLKQIGQFKNNVFDKALREIRDNCGVEISYTNMKSGKSVVGFHCQVTNTCHLSQEQIDRILPERMIKARIVNLRCESRTRELTEEEKAEYERLTAHAQQMQFDFI
jgi:plasmid replication initiation protein